MATQLHTNHITNITFFIYKNNFFRDNFHKKNEWEVSFGDSATDYRLRFTQIATTAQKPNKKG